ncbi:MAG: hypothetical protein FWE67_12040 [Planctomycetaceae bacterium]|nr:hypothetical protein [Planctomycetaceae bacterium]
MNYKIIGVLFCLLLTAGFMRFYKLGEWSFTNDEIPTHIEAFNLFEPNRVLPEIAKFEAQPSHDLMVPQLKTLPRLIPAAHFVHWVDYKLFGEDEFGSRVLMAAIGTLNIGVIFLLGIPLFGFGGSVILAVVVMLFPEHIYYSQYSRFYIQTFFLSSVVFLIGGYISQNIRDTGFYQRLTAAVVIGPLAILMVLTHSITGVVWGIVLVAIFAEFIFQKKQINKHDLTIAAILTFWSLILLAVYFLHIRPITSNWNGGEPTGTSVWGGVQSIVLNKLGWQFSMLSLLGGIVMLLRKEIYHLTCAAGCLAVIIILPNYVPWTAYTFLFLFPFLVLLANGIDIIRQWIASAPIQYARTWSTAVCVIFLLTNLHSIKSYYKDGNRYQWKNVASFILEKYPDVENVLFLSYPANPLYRYLPDKNVWYICVTKGIRRTDSDYFQERYASYASTHDTYVLVIVHASYENLKLEKRRMVDENTQYLTSIGADRDDRVPMLVDVFISNSP